MDDRNFDEFMNFYFLSPSPERTAEALQYYFSLALHNYPDSTVPAAYLFGRLAQKNPELCSVYTELGDNGSEEEKRFIENILSGLSAIPQKPINVLERVIRTPTDNDLLWAEFSLTGDTEPLIRLIDVLERADKIRGKLDQWLQLPENMVGQILGMYRRHVELMRTVIGIKCNRTRQSISSLDDLDCLSLMHDGNFANKKRLKEVGNSLPFPISNEEFIYMAVKATAKWSLKGLAADNDLVLSTIEQEIGNREGRVRLALLEIAAIVRLEKNETEIARKWLRELVQLNPARLDILAKLVPIETKDHLDDLILMDVAVSEQTSSVELSEYMALECVENSKAATSFFSRATLGIRKGPDYDAAKDQPYVEWNGEYSSPSDYHVVQWMDPDDWDAWITMGRQTYQNAGIWFKCKNWIQKWVLANTNKLIKGIRWQKILNNEKPVSSEERTYNGKHYLLLKYETGQLNSIFNRQFPINIRMRSKSIDAKIWLDIEKKLLVKGEATLKNVQGEDGEYHLYFRQVFAGYNTPIVIEKPELMVAPPGLELEAGSNVEFHTVSSESKLFEGSSKSE